MAIMKLTLRDIERMKKDGKIKDFEAKPVKKKAVSKEPKGITYIKEVLTKHGIDFEVEYRFCERKFRFDVAIPSMFIACEYEGLMSKKSRHTSVTGYTKDTEKYNLSAILGWTVLRYTALNYKDFIKDITRLLTFKNRKHE